MHQRTIPHSRILRREPDPSDSFIDLNRLMTILVRRARLIALSVALAIALAVGPEVFADPELATWFQPSYRQQMTLRGVLGLLIGAMRGQSLRPRELALAVDAAIFGVSPRPVRPAA